MRQQGMQALDMEVRETYQKLAESEARAEHLAEEVEELRTRVVSMSPVLLNAKLDEQVLPLHQNLTCVLQVSFDNVHACTIVLP